MLRLCRAWWLAEQSRVGVNNGELVRPEKMFDEESPSSDHPQGHSPSKTGQDLQFLVRASEESGKCRQLGRRLRVTDHGLGVGKQALSGRAPPPSRRRAPPPRTGATGPRR